MNDKLIEAVAMAIYIDTWSDKGGKWELVKTKDVWRGYARAAIAAIEASGTHVVVPVEPSDAMNDAATESVQAGTRTIAEYVRNGLIEAGARLSPAIPYRAMLAARPKVLE